jgi:hypothetical protein
MTDPIQELVDTLAALRQDVNRIERQNAGLVTAVQTAQKAAERIGSTVGADASRAAVERIAPHVSEVRAATMAASKATEGALDAAERIGKGIPRPLALIVLLGLLVALGGTFCIGWYYGPGDWRACPSDRLMVDPKNKAAWCKLN